MSRHPIFGSRRNFLATTGTLAAASMVLASKRADAADISDIEKANEKVVNDFCAAWESRDTDKIGSYLAEDATFRMLEGRPLQEGRDAIMAGTKEFLKNAKSARFQVLRSVVMGNTVLNDRIDHFEVGDRKMSFHITGFFLVKDGKIQEWKDYTWPEAADA